MSMRGVICLYSSTPASSWRFVQNRANKKNVITLKNPPRPRLRRKIEDQKLTTAKGGNWIYVRHAFQDFFLDKFQNIWLGLSCTGAKPIDPHVSHHDRRPLSASLKENRLFLASRSKLLFWVRIQAFFCHSRMLAKVLFQELCRTFACTRHGRSLARLRYASVLMP